MAKKSAPATKPEPSKKQEEEEEEYEEVEVEEDEEEEEEDGDESDDDDEEEDEDDEEAADDSSSKDSIRELLEPFGKDQLIDLLKEAATRDPALLSRISVTAPADPALRRIFVHGLGWDTTTDSLSAAFSSFGEIVECRAVPDRATGRCKGYGFVLFRTVAAARKALKEPQKTIGGRLASCQLASTGPPASHQQPSAQNINQTAALGLLNQSLVQSAGLMGQQGLNLSAGLMGHQQGLNTSTGLMGQGYVGQTAGMLPAQSPYGLGMGLGGGGSGVNSISQSVIGRYGSQAALQGLGSYESNPYSSAAASRSQQAGYGSSGTGLPPYMGRY